MSSEKQVNHGGHREHGDKAILRDCVNSPEMNANGRPALGLFSVSSVLSVVNGIF